MKGRLWKGKKGVAGGGKLAFQVAHAMESRNLDVSALIMIDAARYLKPVDFSEAMLKPMRRNLWAASPARCSETKPFATQRRIGITSRTA